MTKRHESGGGFKVILLGDRNVGKTRLAEWCQSEGYTEEYSASHDPALYRLLMNTNRGPIHFDVWDLPGEVKSIDILRKHVDDADAAILMFDLQNPSSLDSIPLWYDRLPTANEAFPVALCGNKVDLPFRRLGPASITFHREKGLQYNDISIKTGYNPIKPFLFLARRIMNDITVELEQEKAEFAEVRLGPTPAVRPTSAPVHQALVTTQGSGLQFQHRYNTGDEPSSEPPKASHVDDDSQPSTQREGFGSPVCLPPETAADSDVQRRLKRMVSTLQQHPHIQVTEARLGPPTPQHEVDQAREYANGILPDGVEEFYSQVGSFTLEWEHMSPELTTGDLPSTGHIQILPITTTFGDNWRGITWFPLPDHIKPRRDDEWRLTYRGVLPFDFFIPEACMCFIQAPDGTLEDHIAYHSFGHELHRTRYTFKDYIERLVASYGFWYWGETLCSESRFSAQVLSFRANMPRIFEGYEDGLFQP